MTTIEMACPRCGAPGSVPRDKVHSRLVCRKCNAVFHVTPVGRAVLGEPPTSDDSKTTTPRSADVEVEFAVSRAFVVTVASALAIALVLGGIGYGYVSWRSVPSDEIAPRAQSVVDAMTSENLSTLKGMILPGTEDDAMRLYENIRLSLGSVRSKSPTKEVIGKVLVLALTDNETRAQVRGIFTPKLGSTRDQQIASIDVGADTAMATLEYNLWFTKDRGIWRLDGTKGAEIKPTH